MDQEQFHSTYNRFDCGVNEEKEEEEEEEERSGFKRGILIEVRSWEEHAVWAQF